MQGPRLLQRLHGSAVLSRIEHSLNNPEVLERLLWTGSSVSLFRRYRFDRFGEGFYLVLE